jgi:hypothetical protein
VSHGRRSERECVRELGYHARRIAWELSRMPAESPSVRISTRGRVGEPFGPRPSLAQIGAAVSLIADAVIERIEPWIERIALQEARDRIDAERRDGIRRR